MTRFQPVAVVLTLLVGALPTLPAEHAHEFPTSIFTVGKLQAGYVREFPAWRGLVPGIGGTASVSLVPSELASRYGGRAAPGFGVFLSVRPPRHVM